MVGRIGRRPAVANSDQIVDGITAGVANGNEVLAELLVRVIELLERSTIGTLKLSLIPQRALKPCGKEKQETGLYSHNGARKRPAF